ncbi:MAG: sodium-dependent bicarbonate transport family permease, partial [Sphingobium sp.]
LIAGIAVRNLVMPLIGAQVRVLWPSAKQGLALMLDLTLGLFLTMALMGLQLNALTNAFIFIAVVLTIQIAMSITYALYVVFPAMGRDYEAAVVAAAFGGISLGSTATAIANMTSVTRQFGAAPRAFIIVPLVCGFFIDILNAALISFFVG